MSAEVDGKALTAKEAGSVTVEAALVLPVLLCAFFTVIFLIKMVYAYGLIQHAIDETAAEMASAGYIYHISGIRDIHNTVRNGISGKSEIFREQMDSVFDAYNSLKGLGESLEKGTGGLGETAGLLENAEENFRHMLDNTVEAVSNPVDELKIISCYIFGGVFDDAKTQLFIPVLKLYMKKYLVTDSMKSADERLKSLNIKNGFSGLDFSESSFFSDKEENIEIVVRYRIDLPLPVKFTPGFDFIQRAKVKAWMGGDETKGVLNDAEGNAADDIWSLSNFQRGLKIRRLFGANLPTNFPVIARFDGSKAVMIKSMDLTAASYQEGDNAQKTLMKYIDELAGYKGQNKPWGSDDIVIPRDSIKSRELLLVIPKNKLSEANEQMLSEMVAKAGSKGVTLVVERYGTKKR
ncbi:MAG: TadE/TadG family type IV pilus assembly protein [Bacillota bacterium]